jgi:solute carrier family 35 protein
MFIPRTEKSEKEDEGGMSSTSKKAMAAVFYGITSLAVIFTNKAIMTGYNFPFFDFLAAIQFLATTVILGTLVLMKKVDIPVLNYPIFREVFPISLMFLGNVICGLGSTRSLNLPMFTALRRFSILMTMIAEYFILNNKPGGPIVFSVILMVGGALFAAAYDLSYNSWGYTLVFLNNAFTTLNGVWLKKASMSGKCNKMGILFYNSLFSATIMFAFFIMEHYNLSIENIPFDQRIPNFRSNMALHSNHTKPHRVLLNGQIVGLKNNVLNEVKQSTLTKIFLYDGWNKLDFLSLFIFAAFLGSVLNYSIFVCTTINSALSTAVVGCLKNVVTTYIGMLIFPDYAFNWWNFIGINISIAGSLYYTYYTMFRGGK